MTYQTNCFFFFHYFPSYQNRCIMHISNTGHNNSPLEILEPQCQDDHPGVGICNCVDWNIQWIFRVLAWNDEWHSRIRWQGPLRHVKINLAWVMQAGLRIRFNCSFMPCKVGEPSAPFKHFTHPGLRFQRSQRERFTYKPRLSCHFDLVNQVRFEDSPANLDSRITI